ncbi:EscU/YscU/HrcU family type III secretion system export apparatus switch protein [Helicobacter turcicus]|uniref:EscU/YscU/HrcU family type III secretion system export apparatus switch protein n=1 Tax=Helicobacter turcicus TaxID=2867412 RepID=A0ABS7JP32_9HELI|nr:EscU/YscU/HrcU family type III secretion system export apparatus switch protein [Helicobacter turcicus]MBX7491169.1 EscU/YscU/HrcU family type III secretion system export apparatus switch protein [Helicobacter turcicus]MBX7546036.1 EscU/YscU/HrcU family type III secretion system export apparatus switch protein [Helicobacter turcicus]
MLQKNPLNQKAVALAYEQNKQRAPKVIAKGEGFIAEKIIQKAKEYDIPLFQSRALVDSLINLELDEEIPPALYKAVVEVFIWLYQTEKKAQISNT